MLEYFNLESNKVEALYLLLDSGAGIKETAARLKLPVESVKYYKQIRKDTCSKKVPDLDSAINKLVPELNQHNADRHLCKKCIHRAKNFSYKATGRPGCDYICNTGEERGCDVECCNKFEEGASLSYARARIYQKKVKQQKLEAEAKRRTILAARDRR